MIAAIIIGYIICILFTYGMLEDLEVNDAVDAFFKWGLIIIWIIPFILVLSLLIVTLGRNFTTFIDKNTK